MTRNAIRQRGQGGREGGDGAGRALEKKEVRVVWLYVSHWQMLVLHPSKGLVLQARGV